jgi:hypothetical protein
MTLPKRIRLMKSCYDHLYGEVKRTLATDKEIRNLRELQAKIERAYVLLTKPRKHKVLCSLRCGFEDTFESNEFGVNYFQAEGTCPDCNAPTVYKNGKPTKIEIVFTVKEGIGNG